MVGRLVTLLEKVSKLTIESFIAVITNYQSSHQNVEAHQEVFCLRFDGKVAVVTGAGQGLVVLSLYVWLGKAPMSP